LEEFAVFRFVYMTWLDGLAGAGSQYLLKKPETIPFQWFRMPDNFGN